MIAQGHRKRAKLESELLLLVAVVWFGADVARAEQRTTVTLPVTVHVAERSGAPVVDETFVAERIARANEIFAVQRVQFAVTARKTLPERHAAMETRADRDALGAYFTRGTLHVFVVESLMDVDEPGRVRRGVHWRSAKHRGAHFVIVSAISGPSVVAHELGHYLGNPEHSDVPGNLMSYEHTDVLPFLDDAQAKKLQRRLKAYLASRELVAIPYSAPTMPTEAPRTHTSSEFHPPPCVMPRP